MSSDPLKRRIQSMALALYEEVRGHRRHLHSNPELSFEEYNTSEYVAQELKKIGVEVETGWGGTGLVAKVRGKNPESKTVALRADMDALPIVEQNEVAYKSQRDGVMHACGHDVHTSSLLGTVRILHELRGEIEGTYRCIFQPGEEKYPGGASILVKEGILKNPQPKGIFGQHVHPTLPAGKIGVRAGQFMASADELYITVKGKGGHGAAPHKVIDPILISAHLITALQQLVSRNADPLVPSVVTIGKINSKGGATNIIPEEVSMLGTFRTFDEVWRHEAHEKMMSMAQQLVSSMGGVVDFEIQKTYPFLHNDETLTEKAQALMYDYVGKENVVDLPPRMGAEDFAFYSHEIPACFYRLGSGFSNETEPRSLHSPTFDIDENCLKLSTGLMAWLAING